MFNKPKKTGGRGAQCPPAITAPGSEIVAMPWDSDKKNYRKLIHIALKGLIRQVSEEKLGLSKEDLNKRKMLVSMKIKSFKLLHNIVLPTRLLFTNLPPNWNGYLLHQRILEAVDDERAEIVQLSRQSESIATVTFTLYEHALKAQQKLNNNPDIFSPEERPIVQFCVENALKKHEKKKEKLLRKINILKNIEKKEKFLPKNLKIKSKCRKKSKDKRFDLPIDGFRIAFKQDTSSTPVHLPKLSTSDNGVCAMEQSDPGVASPQESDKKNERNLHLAREGWVHPRTEAAQGVSKEDLDKRMQRKLTRRKLLKDLNNFVSPTTLLFNNLPPNLNKCQLKQMIVEAVDDECAEIVEARIFRCQDSERFLSVTFTLHEHALKALRKLNNNPDVFTPDRRPIVEFCIEDRSNLNDIRKNSKTKKKPLTNSKKREKLLKNIQKRERLLKRIEENPHLLFEQKRLHGRKILQRFLTEEEERFRKKEAWPRRVEERRKQKKERLKEEKKKERLKNKRERLASRRKQEEERLRKKEECLRKKEEWLRQVEERLKDERKKERLKNKTERLASKRKQSLNLPNGSFTTTIKQDNCSTMLVHMPKLNPSDNGVCIVEESVPGVASNPSDNGVSYTCTMELSVPAVASNTSDNGVNTMEQSLRGVASNPSDNGVCIVEQSVPGVASLLESDKKEEKDERNLHLASEDWIQPGTEAAQGVYKGDLDKRMQKWNTSDYGVCTMEQSVPGEVTPLDERNLHLAIEGWIQPGTEEAQGVSKEDLDKRMQRELTRRKLLQDLNNFVSPTTLFLNNFPPSLNRYELQQLILEAVDDERAEIVTARIFRYQNSEVFSSVTFTLHEHALKALRKLNNNPDVFTPDCRPIVEFWIEDRSKFDGVRKNSKKNEKHPRIITKNQHLRFEEKQNKEKKRVDKFLMKQDQSQSFNLPNSCINPAFKQDNCSTTLVHMHENYIGSRDSSSQEMHLPVSVVEPYSSGSMDESFQTFSGFWAQEEREKMSSHTGQESQKRSWRRKEKNEWEPQSRNKQEKWNTGRWQNHQLYCKMPFNDLKASYLNFRAGRSLFEYA